MAGFKGPLFLLGLSAAAAVTQGGFNSPLPVPPVGASTGATQAGFVGPIPVLRLYAGGAVIAPEAPSRPSGLRPRLIREDEEILAIIIAATYTIN